MMRTAVLVCAFSALIVCCHGRPAKAGGLEMVTGPQGQKGGPVVVTQLDKASPEVKKSMDDWANKLKSNVTASLKQDKVQVEPNHWQAISYAGLGKSGCCNHLTQMLIRVNNKKNGYVLVRWWQDDIEKTVSDISYLPNQTKDAKYVQLQ